MWSAVVENVGYLLIGFTVRCIPFELHIVAVPVLAACIFFNGVGCFESAGVNRNSRLYVSAELLDFGIDYLLAYLPCFGCCA